jgi:hypothetical protein
MNINGTETNRAPALAATGEAAQPKTSGRTRSRLFSGWHFTRHLLEMVLAMVAGMALLGAAFAALGEPPGYANLFVRYGLMGASMAAPMVAWMRYRGHSWRDGAEMTAAMLVPMLAPVALVELGVALPGLSGGSLMVLSHVAMIGGMVALIAYRFDRYAYGPHEQESRQRHEEATS